MSCHQEELGISPKTVEKYDEHIKIKLGAARQPLGISHRQTVPQIRGLSSPASSNHLYRKIRATARRFERRRNESRARRSEKSPWHLTSLARPNPATAGCGRLPVLPSRRARSQLLKRSAFAFLSQLKPTPSEAFHLSRRARAKADQHSTFSPRRTADVLPVVVSCQDRYEKGIWHDHLFAERSDSLSGVAIRLLARP